MYETNQVAVIRTSGNFYSWLPIMLDDNSEGFVRYEGEWYKPKDMRGFLRTETSALQRLGPRSNSN
jgi:hypothetical protein